jgi:predicted PurR-regulated permease PerM
MLIKNKKGNITLYLSFFFIATVIVVLTSILAPLGTNISSKFYTAGDRMLAQNSGFIADISDEDIKAELNETFNSARDASENNIEVLSAIYKYSWVIVTLIVALGLFLYSRMQVERSQMGFV